ncbi:helix-turn-helix transcriptional regulator [Rhodobacteraceae bacterium]|nr:helix-turn-helix transcriptional regulator [Paracoccaceae bacterium]
MSVDIFPGEFRIGVLDVDKTSIEDGSCQQLTPKCQLLILLSGRHVFDIGAQRFDLDARITPAALMMAIHTPTTLRHIESNGHPYRKLAIATPLEWAVRMGSLPQALQLAGNGFWQWAPDKDTIALATQIIAPPPQGGSASSGLYRMSRGMELLRRIVSEAAPQEGGLATVAERTRLYLRRHLARDVDLAELERHLGLNRRSLQRRFKAAFGVTICEYMRQERLALAYRALSEDGVTIAQAAFAARYRSPENFTTAFKRQFKLTPGQLRNHVI